MWTHGDVSTTVDQKRRFMAAVRSGHHMFAEIARLSGEHVQRLAHGQARGPSQLGEHERPGAHGFAEGVKAGKLCIADDMPGFRHVAEVAQ